eukprot:1154044-Pelagomonas_calceolata.AAC.3
MSVCLPARSGCLLNHLASRNKNKKNINVGKAGDLTGGLDDYIYDDAGDADDGECIMIIAGLILLKALRHSILYVSCNAQVPCKLQSWGLLWGIPFKPEDVCCRTRQARLLGSLFLSMLLFLPLYDVHILNATEDAGCAIVSLDRKLWKNVVFGTISLLWETESSRFIEWTVITNNYNWPQRWTRPGAGTFQHTEAETERTKKGGHRQSGMSLAYARMSLSTTIYKPFTPNESDHRPLPGQ